MKLRGALSPTCVHPGFTVLSQTAQQEWVTKREELDHGATELEEASLQYTWGHTAVLQGAFWIWGVMGARKWMGLDRRLGTWGGRRRGTPRSHKGVQCV